ncbi:PaaI family thioesterase [Alkalicoccus saliphilus]|uniref:Phenylacetic acid degradation protein n=1 Tax=Alkalicoccus saliphilus TaxID=200989 RepID=A0A2T4U2Y5_9BACI|nr:PaaI family thioesterase [Alkalicoccus saliphilus]PTL37760.1 phenylacetic acid degradation protein [Alkalicoccus saliphilus]
MKLSKELQEVQEKFSESPFWQTMGFELDHLEEGKSILKMPVSKGLENVLGTLHGGAYAGLLDTAMGITGRSVEKQPLVTIDMTIHYFRAVSEGAVYAEGKVLSRSSSLITLEAKAYDESNNMVAHSVGGFKISRKASQR